MAEVRKVILKSKDNQTFEVEESVAMESHCIRCLMKDVSNVDQIPVLKVQGKILAKVIDYCKYHLDSQKVDENKSEVDVKRWDTEFLKVDRHTLFDLILAADYLNINKLLDLTCETAADIIKDKSPEEIRKMFNIKNDFTPEEEAEVRKENAWAFE